MTARAQPVTARRARSTRRARPLPAAVARALFPSRALPTSRLHPGEIVVDLFAGGGGASEGLREALGRDPDIAINHDEWAIALHAANHPLTRHLRTDIWHADPRREVGGRAIGWLHASPDCTHFSQAKGGQPRSHATRSLSWVVLKWAGAVRPRIISLENVEQILKWGPLVAKRDKATGRVLRLDGSVAAPGERVPLREQFLIPDKRHAGRTWRAFVAALRRLGYAVEWNKLIASDYGAGTSRKRLFLIARRDGQPIAWPTPTHGKAPGLLPLVTAADCIDFSVPCPSIFTRKKPLADATLRRIAKGLKRYVIDAAEPFIVGCGGRAAQTAERPVLEPLNTITSKADACVATATIAPLITEHANASTQRTMPSNEPLRTICAQVKGGHFSVVAPTLIQASHGEGSGATARRGSGAHAIEQPVGTIHAGGGSFAVAAATLVQTDIGAPLGTIVGGGVKHAVVSPFLEQANGSGSKGNPARARSATEPVSAITGTGSQQRLVTAHMAKLRGTSHAADVTEPLHTISAGGEHHAVVECTLSPEVEAGALRVAAFLVNYYGNGTALDLRAPLDTVTTRDRLALVTVTIRGTPYVIVDIGLRMLRPAELFRAQGFPPDYIIDRTADGRRVSGTRAVRMVGNSVSPPPLRALASANLEPLDTDSEFPLKEAA